MITKCKHARPLPAPYRDDMADCAIGRFFRPHHSACARCDSYDGPPREPVAITVSAPTPRPLSLEQLVMIDARREICRGCDQARSISERMPIVGCNACGCGGLSLVRGTCRLGKWS